MYSANVAANKAGKVQCIADPKGSEIREIEYGVRACSGSSGEYAHGEGAISRHGCDQLSIGFSEKPRSQIYDADENEKESRHVYVSRCREVVLLYQEEVVGVDIRLLQLVSRHVWGVVQVQKEA